MEPQNILCACLASVRVEHRLHDYSTLHIRLHLGSDKYHLDDSIIHGMGEVATKACTRILAPAYYCHACEDLNGQIATNHIASSRLAHKHLTVVRDR